MNKNKIIIVISAALLALLVLIAIAPYIFLWRVYNAKDFAQMGKLHDMSVNAAIIPYTKAQMRLNRGYYYFSVKNGPKALEDFEYAYQNKRLRKSGECRLSANAAGILYAIKGDYKKALSMHAFAYNYNAVAVDCIAMKNYTRALEFINVAIRRTPRNCWNYCTRAIIYKNLGKNSLAQKDLNAAINKCPNKATEFKYAYANHKTYYTQKYQSRKKEYGF